MLHCCRGPTQHGPPPLLAGYQGTGRTRPGRSPALESTGRQRTGSGRNRTAIVPTTSTPIDPTAPPDVTPPPDFFSGPEGAALTSAARSLLDAAAAFENARCPDDGLYPPQVHALLALAAASVPEDFRIEAGRYDRRTAGRVPHAPRGLSVDHPVGAVGVFGAGSFPGRFHGEPVPVEVQYMGEPATARRHAQEFGPEQVEGLIAGPFAVLVCTAALATLDPVPVGWPDLAPAD